MSGSWARWSDISCRPSPRCRCWDPGSEQTIRNWVDRGWLGAVAVERIPLEMIKQTYEDPDSIRPSDDDELREIRTRWFAEQGIEVVVDVYDGRVGKHPILCAGFPRGRSPVPGCRSATGGRGSASSTRWRGAPRHHSCLGDLIVACGEAIMARHATIAGPGG